jgi:hemerythrin superfamily protein
MSVQLEDTKRTAIATQLAEMKEIQNLLILTDQTLLKATEDDDIRVQLQKMLEQDRKNLGILETVSIQHGVPGALQENVQHQVEEAQRLIHSSELTLLDKVFQHELLKHRQTMTGLIIHKAAQRVGADVEAAIAPIHTVNFENCAHQEQLKGILEVVGVRELTGVDADQGLWARAEDVAAAVIGVVGSVVTRLDDEMSIRDVLLMDHSKTDILFAELLGSNDPRKIQEYFGQLYRDVKIHGLAEEQVLYPALSPYYNKMQAIVEQTDHVIEMLDEIRMLNLTDPDFKARIEQLRLAVREHIDQEESDIFPNIREHLSHEQQKRMATEFKAAKSQLQEQAQSSPPPMPPTPAIQDNSSNSPDSWIIYLNQAIHWNRVFQAKAIINWVEAIILLVGDRQIRSFLQTEPLVNDEYSQLFYGLVFIIGIGYWWVSQNRIENLGIVKLGIYAQLSVFALLAYHTTIGHLHPFFLLSGILDLIFAILFSIFLYSNHQVAKQGF